MNEKFSQKNEQDKLDTLAKLWTRMIACVIHDTTTPLLNVQMAGDNAQKLLSSLIPAYQLAVENKLISTPPLKKGYIDAVVLNLNMATGENVAEVQSLFKVLYPYCKKLFSDIPETISSAKNFIEIHVEKFPSLSEEEKKLIHIDYRNDFQFVPVLPFIDYLFEQLLSNALKAIRQIDKGKIHIRTSAGTDKKNIICFKYDVNPTRNNAEDEEKIFENFFLKKNNEIIPGLGFCKLALIQKNGDVVYKPVDGGIEFLIQFPSIKT